MGRWMDEWVTFLCELLLRWATFLLRHLFSQLLLFSEQPLNWATSALTCLPASSSVASATQVFSSLSFYNAFSNLQPPAAIPQEYHYGRYNAFSNLQLQSRLPGASQHQMLSCAEPCQCVLSQPAANPHGIAGASHQLDQRSGSADNGTSATQIRGCSEHLNMTLFLRCFFEIELSLQSLAHFAGLMFQKCSKRLSSIFVWNRAFATSCALLPTSSSKSAPRPSVF